jgi:hypothetical protein
MEPERFRTFFLHRLAPFLGLAIPALLFWLSPVGQSWPQASWIALGALAGAAAIAYTAMLWLRGVVLLDERGVTLRVPSGTQTLPYDTLLKVKQIGRYRVRMCFATDDPDVHRHISVDVWDSDGLADALIDWTCEMTGHELTHPLALEEAA